MKWCIRNISHLCRSTFCRIIGLLKAAFENRQNSFTIKHHLKSMASQSKHDPNKMELKVGTCGIADTRIQVNILNVDDQNDECCDVRIKKKHEQYIHVELTGGKAEAVGFQNVDVGMQKVDSMHMHGRVKVRIHENEHKAVGCAPCEEVDAVYKNKSTEPHYFIVHMSDFRRKSQDRAIRKKALHNLEKKVCALRNTLGGDILIHLSEQSQGDRYLGHFDEFISAIIPTVAEYGEVATDICKRIWLYKKKGLEHFQNFVLLTVSKSPWLVTMDFNTRIRNDFETARPTHLSILSLLSKNATNHVQTKPNIRGIPDNLQELHECRDIELKAFHPKESVLMNIVKDPKQLASYIWRDLKLKDSVTSMSKLPEGGSYYVGIGEKRKKCQTYESIVPDIVGIKVSVSEEQLRDELLQLAQTNLSVLYSKSTSGITAAASAVAPGPVPAPAPKDLLEISMIRLESGAFVVEVAISYFDGIVFSDNNGPRSYKIHEGEIVRMSFEEWVGKLFEMKCLLPTARSA